MTPNNPSLFSPVPRKVYPQTLTPGCLMARVHFRRKKLGGPWKDRRRRKSYYLSNPHPSLDVEDKLAERRSRDVAVLEREAMIVAKLIFPVLVADADLDIALL
jgi:hypothetical protein